MIVEMALFAALHLPKFDSSWWTRAHAFAAAYDGASTAYVFHNCKSCYEGDPFVRSLIGRRPSTPKMLLLGSAEVGLVAIIPNKKIRRITQITLIGVHIYAGTHNWRVS